MCLPLHGRSVPAELLCRLYCPLKNFKTLRVQAIDAWHFSVRLGWLETPPVLINERYLEMRDEYESLFRPVHLRKSCGWVGSIKSHDPLFLFSLSLPIYLWLCAHNPFIGTDTGGIIHKTERKTWRQKRNEGNYLPSQWAKTLRSGVRRTNAFASMIYEWLVLEQSQSTIL